MADTKKKIYPSDLIVEDNKEKLNFLSKEVFRGLDKVKIENLILDYIIRRKDDIIISISDNVMNIIEKKERS